MVSIHLAHLVTSIHKKLNWTFVAVSCENCCLQSQYIKSFISVCSFWITLPAYHWRASGEVSISLQIWNDGNTWQYPWTQFWQEQEENLPKCWGEFTESLLIEREYWNQLLDTINGRSSLKTSLKSILIWSSYIFSLQSSAFNTQFYM